MAVVLPLGVNRSLVRFSEFWCEKHDLNHLDGYQRLEEYVRGQGATQHGTFTPAGKSDEHSASTLTLNPSILRLAELWSELLGRDNQYAYQMMDRYVWDEGSSQPGTWVAGENGEEDAAKGSEHQPHYQEPSPSGSEHQTHPREPSVSDPKHLADSTNSLAPRDHSSANPHRGDGKHIVQYLPNSKKRSASIMFLDPEGYAKKKARHDREKEVSSYAGHDIRHSDMVLGTSPTVASPGRSVQKVRRGASTPHNTKYAASEASKSMILSGSSDGGGPTRDSEVSSTTSSSVTATNSQAENIKFIAPKTPANSQSAAKPTHKKYEQKPESRLHFNKLAIDGVLKVGDRLHIPQSPTYVNGNTYSALNNVHADMEYIGRAGGSQTSWRVHCPQLGINALPITGKGPEDFRKQLKTHAFEGPCGCKWSNTVRYVRNGRDLGSVNEVKGRECLQKRPDLVWIVDSTKGR